MAECLYFVGNYALPTTGVPAGATTGVSATVLLQLAAPSTRQLNIVEYGVSFSGSPAAAALSLRSSNVAAASAATTAASIVPYNNPNAPTSLCVSGTALTCFATASGTTAVAPTGTVNMMYDAQLLTSNTYIKQFPLSREPVVAVSEFCQVCVQVPTTSVNALTYLIWREG